ncbi:MAG: hypothetical protein ACRC6D_07170, partial [Aeromonas sp.]
AKDGMAVHEYQTDDSTTDVNVGQPYVGLLVAYFKLAAKGPKVGGERFKDKKTAPQGRWRRKVSKLSVARRVASITGAA